VALLRLACDEHLIDFLEGNLFGLSSGGRAVKFGGRFSRGVIGLACGSGLVISALAGGALIFGEAEGRRWYCWQADGLH